MNEDTKKRIRQLYQFLREANQLRFRPVRQLCDQPKVVSLTEIPQHPALQIIRPVRTSSGLEIPDQLLRVRRPALSRCPQPPEIVNEWLLPGWDDPTKPGSFAESRNAVSEDGGTITIRFDDDKERVAVFNTWNDLRSAWAPPEILARQALRFFEIFYDIHSMLEKDGEQLELLVAEKVVLLKVYESAPVRNPHAYALHLIEYEDRKTILRNSSRGEIAVVEGRR